VMLCFCVFVIAVDFCFCTQNYVWTCQHSICCLSPS
jgi:hypothetical protein